MLTGCGLLSERELNLIRNHNLNSESEADAEFGLCAEAMEASKSCPTEARAPLFSLSQSFSTIPQTHTRDNHLQL